MCTKNTVRAVSSMIVATLGLVLSSHATVLVSNTFNTGVDSYPASPTYSEMGVDSNSSGDLESAWFYGGAGTLDPVGAGGPERGNLTGTGGSSASWTTYFTPEGSEVNLALGDSLKITWVFSLSGVNAGNTSQNFRLALVNTPSAARLAADGAPGTAAYTGYSMFMNMGPTMGNGNSFQLREFAGGSSAFLSGSSAWLALTNGVASGATGYVAGTPYTYTMVLTRVASGLDISSTMSGGSVGGTGTITDSYLDTTPNGGSYQFDTFGIRPSGESTTASIFDTSLFKVEVIVVPEPSTVLLVAMGLGGLLISRRRLSR
jgi:hypothetical protein